MQKVPAPIWSMKGFLSIMAAVVVTASAYTAIVKFSPFAWSSDLRIVAGTAFETALSRKDDLLASQEDRFEQCKAENRNCSSIRKRIKRLKREIRELESKQTKQTGS